MRRVSVMTSASNSAKRFETNARTWGDLKPEIERQGLSLSGVEALLRPGNVTLSRNDAELPDEDFKVFLIPTKNKAGDNLTEEANAIGTALAAAIIKGCKLAGENRLRELKKDLIEEVETFFDVDFDADDVDDFPDDDEPENSDQAEFRQLSRS